LTGFRPRHDDLSRIALARRKFQLRQGCILLEGDATMTGAYRGRRESGGEDPQQVGPVHSIDAIPAMRVGCEHSADERSIHTVVGRTIADLCTDLGQRLAQFHSFKLSQTVRKQHKAGTDLAERVTLLPDCDVDSPSQHSVRGCKTANSPSDNGHFEALACHGAFPFPLPAKHSSGKGCFAQNVLSGARADFATDSEVTEMGQ
jgi:hypothetical protein